MKCIFVSAHVTGLGPPVTGDESLSEAGTTWILGAGCLAFLNFENMPNTNE